MIPTETLKRLPRTMILTASSDQTSPILNQQPILDHSPNGLTRRRSYRWIRLGIWLLGYSVTLFRKRMGSYTISTGKQRANMNLVDIRPTIGRVHWCPVADLRLIRYSDYKSTYEDARVRTKCSRRSTVC
jgi:hypothetical protein